MVCDGVFLRNVLLHHSLTSSGTSGSATWYQTANYAAFPLAPSLSAPSLSAELFICSLHLSYGLQMIITWR